MMQLGGQIWLQRGRFALQLQRCLHRQLWEGRSNSSRSSSGSREEVGLLGRWQRDQLGVGSWLLLGNKTRLGRNL